MVGHIPSKTFTFTSEDLLPHVANEVNEGLYIISMNLCSDSALTEFPIMPASEKLPVFLMMDARQEPRHFHPLGVR